MRLLLLISKVEDIFSIVEQSPAGTSLRFNCTKWKNNTARQILDPPQLLLLASHSLAQLRLLRRRNLRAVCTPEPAGLGEAAEIPQGAGEKAAASPSDTASTRVQKNK